MFFDDSISTEEGCENTLLNTSRICFPTFKSNSAEKFVLSEDRDELVEKALEPDTEDV